jgi:GNAT superfamily N-acetyltransferase
VNAVPLPAYSEEPLGNHDRAVFNCGKDPLTDYFTGDEVTRQIRSHDTAAFILKAENDDRIAGYYTMSNAAILRSLLPRKMRNELRYATTPALLIGRLARDLAFKGRGVGQALLEKAWLRCIDVSARTGCAVLIVDTIDDEARDYYDRAGFQPLPAPQPVVTTVQCECGKNVTVDFAPAGSNYDMQRMYMPLAQVRSALEELGRIPERLNH